MSNRSRNDGGFTWWEIIVAGMMAILIVIFAMNLHNRGRLNYRQEEVKSNLHAIQIALERYAADNGGRYPLILYGGDATDTFASFNAPINSGTGKSYYYPPEEPNYSPFAGDVDVLIQYGYLAQYPANPFRDKLRKKTQTNPAQNGFGPLEFRFDRDSKSRVSIWAEPRDRALESTRRLVGGINGNLMWDVSEGQRHAPWPILLSEPPQKGLNGYLNPIGSEQTNVFKRTRRGDHQFPLTEGNFYYYAVFGAINGYSAFHYDPTGELDPNAPLALEPSGYHLAGYGAAEDSGLDVYNLWGDYSDRSFGTCNFDDCRAIAGGKENITAGPDGRSDGVILVLDSGIKWGGYDGPPLIGDISNSNAIQSCSCVKDQLPFAE